MYNVLYKSRRHNLHPWHALELMYVSAVCADTVSLVAIVTWIVPDKLHGAIVWFCQGVFVGMLGLLEHQITTDELYGAILYLLVS